LPDLLVRCYKDDVNEDMYPGNKYYGVPLIIIEIISPSNLLEDFNVDISELLKDIQISQDDLEKVTKRKIITYQVRK
jgi:hypothetical protein